MKSKILLITLFVSGVAISQINTITNPDVEYISFDKRKTGLLSCVEQKNKAGTIVFSGLMSEENYKDKYKGFWLKDSGLCAYRKK